MLPRKFPLAQVIEYNLLWIFTVVADNKETVFMFWTLFITSLCWRFTARNIWLGTQLPPPRVGCASKPPTQLLIAGLLRLSLPVVSQDQRTPKDCLSFLAKPCYRISKSIVFLYLSVLKQTFLRRKKNQKAYFSNRNYNSQKFQFLKSFPQGLQVSIYNIQDDSLDYVF